MSSRVNTRFLAACVTALCAVALLVPSLAAADGPTAPIRTPQRIGFQGFEPAEAVNYSLTQWTTSLGGPSTAWWGRKSASGSYRTGLWGLWCAGTQGTWPSYPVDSAGFATFAVPQAADYFATSADLWYRMPSLGVAEQDDGFRIAWRSDALKDYARVVYGLPLTSSWTHLVFDLSQRVEPWASDRGGNLSRNPGAVVLVWEDSPEGPPPDPLKSVVKVGTGPSVDDFAVTGWRYGPPRNVQATPSSGQILISWSRPYASTAGSELETRSIGYRVFRTLSGQSAWTQLTSSLLQDDGTTGTFGDATAASGTSYTYSVQAFDASGGYGLPATPHPVAATLSAYFSGTSSATLPTQYASPAGVWGEVADAALGFPIGGSGQIVLDRSLDSGAHYTASGLTPLEVLGAAGRYQVIVPGATTRTWYRLRFLGTSAYTSKSSRWINVYPRAYLTLPYAPATMYRTRAYTMWGYLKPRHTAGTSPVRIYGYRWERQTNGVYTWRLRVNVLAKVSNYSDYSKYAKSVLLPYTGKWRLRAFHSDAGHYATYTSYRYVTVK